MMKEGFTALVVGILFGLGLTISGMTMPQKVIGFLDIFGNWDPTLAFVMIGAIGVHFIAYRIVKHRTSPLLASKFLIPEKKSIDKPLLLGAAIFGMGWGLGGYCPGPAVTSVVSFKPEILIFVGMMAVGMFLQDIFAKKFVE